MSKHFKMYITINNIICEKRIDLDYVTRGKEVAVVSIFSDNVQFRVQKPLKVLMSNEERMLTEGTFTASELSTFAARDLLIAPLGGRDNIIKTNKLARITEMVISLNELNNSDNLEDGKPSNVLPRYHVTDSEEFTSFKPVSPQYKKLEDVKFTSLNLRIMDQKGKCR